MESIDPCQRAQCGSNTECRNGICTCIQGYFGDPYSGCRPECLLNTDCPKLQACSRNKCIDPCRDNCGENAICEVINHIAMCQCPPDRTGNAFIKCTPIQQQQQQQRSKIYSNDFMAEWLSKVVIYSTFL